MQDHIKTFRKRLRGMGFQKKSDRVFWYDNNGLFYHGLGGWTPAAGWIRTADALRDARLLDALFADAAAFCAQFNTAQDWEAYRKNRAG